MQPHHRHQSPAFPNEIAWFHAWLMIEGNGVETMGEEEKSRRIAS